MLLFVFYTFGITIFYPFFYLLILLRLKKGKEDPLRFSERFGRASRSKPAGSLIWFHAASIGESLSILPLIKLMLNDEELKDFSFLITTGTLSSKQVLEKYHPDLISGRVIHQFFPYDHPLFMYRFFRHWRPILAVFVEQEIWPFCFFYMQKTKIKNGIINVRFSNKTFNLWLYFKRFFRFLLKDSFILVQDADFKKKIECLFKKSSRNQIFNIGNLKYDVPKLSLNESLFSSFYQACAYLDSDKNNKKIHHRFIFCAASTHEGEEEIILNGFLDFLHLIQNDLPCIDPSTSPLCIIVPRHTKRVLDIQTLCKKMNLISSIRTEDGNKELLNCNVYIANTFGEVALFYKVADVVFIGGTLSESVGGHNPLEAARFGKPQLAGPSRFNFKEIFLQLEQNNGIISTPSCASIRDTLVKMYKDPSVAYTLGQNAYLFVDSLGGATMRAHHLLKNFLLM